MTDDNDISYCFTTAQHILEKAFNQGLIKVQTHEGVFPVNFMHFCDNGKILIRIKDEEKTSS